MPYERNQRVVEWFEKALQSQNPQVRWNAVALLEHVECEERSGWIERALADKHSHVRSTAALAQKALRKMVQTRTLELCESDFMDEIDSPDLEWEWEYGIVLIRGLDVPAVPTFVWMVDEDDELARRLALLKGNVADDDSDAPLAVIVQKRAVTKFTRSPRSLRESQSWIDEGRPSYRDACGDIDG